MMGNVFGKVAKCRRSGRIRNYLKDLRIRVVRSGRYFIEIDENCILVLIDNKIHGYWCIPHFFCERDFQYRNKYDNQMNLKQELGHLKLF